MMVIPEHERIKFESLLLGQAERFDLTPKEYLRKIWYHEEAARIGEYMAMMLLDQLLSIAPIASLEEEELLQKVQEIGTEEKTESIAM